ncbi:4Fe-4S dicluster domain-containing protein [Chloroflexota bacterium]
MKKVYVNEEVCMGCRLCEVHCQLKHSSSTDIIKAFKRETPVALPRVRLEEKRPLCFSVRCQHCEDAPCTMACLTGALHQDPESGVVSTDEEKCIGCWTCILACPFGAIRQDTIQGKMAKCDLCAGEEIPVCVANCPNEALVYAENGSGLSA